MCEKNTGYTGYTGYNPLKTAWISQKTCNRFSKVSGYRWLQEEENCQTIQNTNIKNVQSAVMSTSRSLPPSGGAPTQNAAHGYASTVARRADMSQG